MQGLVSTFYIRETLFSVAPIDHLIRKDLQLYPDPISTKAPSSTRNPQASASERDVASGPDNDKPSPARRSGRHESSARQQQAVTGGQSQPHLDGTGADTANTTTHPASSHVDYINAVLPSTEDRVQTASS